MGGVGRYIVARVGLTIPMLLVLLTVVFVILRVMPGDPCLAMLGGRNVSGEQIQGCRRALGVDRPLPAQYLGYVESLARGELGTSIRTGLPVLHELGLRLPATIELAFTGMLLAATVGLITGIVAATHPDRPVDHAIRLFNIASFAMPVFWVGLMLLIIFAVQLGWLPVGGRLDPVTFIEPITGLYLLDSLLHAAGGVLRGDPGAAGEALATLWDVVRHLLLPAVTLGLVASGLVGRMTRASMLEVLGHEYVTVARAKGLRERVVVLRHALRNALIPILTVVGLQFALLMGGAILTETVFSWPGIARYLIESIENRDFPAIQGTVVFIAMLISAVNLIVDVLYARLDPRIRY